MYRWIADRVKGMWHGDHRGKVLLILLVGSAIFALIGLGLGHGIKSAFVTSEMGCGLDEKTMKARAEVFLNQVEMEYGKSKPMGRRRVFEQAQFDILYESTWDPCDHHFSIRVPIDGPEPSPLPHESMLELLEDRKVGGRHERGLGGVFVYDEDARRYYLVFSVVMWRLPNGDLLGAIEERRRIGDAWRRGWFEEVWRIGMGEAVAPMEPDSEVRRIEAPVKDAGGRGTGR
jgi:hypothetical protein